MSRARRRGRVVASAALATTLCWGMAATTTARASTSSVAGGSITVAEAPGSSPNYVFPFMSCQYFSIANVERFQQLIYRPLYWFGLGASTAVQPALSPARPPVFTDANTTVTISMRGWKFSNGEPIDAQSAQFFLNMYDANPTAFCPYNPGYGIPDDVKGVTHAGNVLTLTLSAGVNPTWFLYNYLSEVTPLPRAWDKTSLAAASGSGHCGTGAWGAAGTAASCRAVEHFLSTMGANTSTFVGPLWGVVDGPYRIASYEPPGNVTFTRNNAYSGPQRSAVAQVRELAFGSQLAEAHALAAGLVSLGYVDPTSLPGPAPSPGAVGPQLPALAKRYRLHSTVPWAFDYAPFNFSRANPAGALIGQPYIRAAIQGTVSQVRVVRTALNGYGAPTCSPLPPTTPSWIAAPVGCAYPYDPSQYRTLLATHGWSVHKGTYVCTRPGVSPTQCGKGIAKGAPLAFSIIWEAGAPALDRTLLAEIAGWSAFGIKVTHATGSLYRVIDECHGGTFAMCAWSSGWTYAPGYYPSGEALFTPRGAFDVGSFSDPKMTALVASSTTSAPNLTAYAQYAAHALPGLYLPVPAPAIEISSTLHGVLAPSPLDKLMPEYLHY